MRRIGIPDDLTFLFPSDDAVLLIYIYDCSIIRARQNTWGTMRGKLRSIDYVAQLCGVKQSWSDNPALFTATQYVKRKNPGKGSDTLPINSKLVVQIIEYVLDKYVYHGLRLSPIEQSMRMRWESFPKIWTNGSRCWWYCWCLSVLTIAVLGLRGAECYENSNPDYAGYGISLSDLTFFWKTDANQIPYPSNDLSQRLDCLHHVRVKLRNWKTGFEGQSTFLRIGRTDRRLEPVILLYHWYQLRTSNFQGTQKPPAIPNHHIFADAGASTTEITLQKAKKKWMLVVEDMGLLEWKRLRFHGLRKGWATTLMLCGIALSLIAFGGRWKLKAAIFAYILHSQKELIPLTKVYLYGTFVKQVQLDFDDEEYNAVASLRDGSISISPDLFKASADIHNFSLEVSSPPALEVIM